MHHHLTGSWSKINAHSTHLKLSEIQTKYCFMLSLIMTLIFYLIYGIGPQRIYTEGIACSKNQIIIDIKRLVYFNRTIIILSHVSTGLYH